MNHKILLLLSFVWLIASCAGAENVLLDDDNYELEGTPLADAEDENGCLPHETYEAATDSCGVDISCDTEDECNAILDDLYADYEYVDLEYWEMEPEDCLDGELYDEQEAVCYIECDSEAECAAKADEIYSGVDVYYNDSYAGHSGKPDSRVPSDEPAQVPAANSEDNSGGIPAIARYELDSDLNLTLLQLDESSKAEYKEQNRHQEIWRFLSRTLPKNMLREEASEFHIFTDGASETLAYVSPLAYDKSHWLIGIDIEDAGTSGQLGGEIGLQEFIHTTVHEFAHIVTLENDQVPPDTTIDLNSQDEMSEGQKNCQNFYPGEGCANADSYINLFYQRFWADIFDEYDESVNYAETEEEYYENTAKFYEKYQDRFVSEYAGTNPGEDIAESFTAFVLKDKPTGDSIADEKVRFFYQFPPLLQVRSYIRSQLARVDS